MLPKPWLERISFVAQLGPVVLAFVSVLRLLGSDLFERVPERLRQAFALLTFLLGVLGFAVAGWQRQTFEDQVTTQLRTANQQLEQSLAALRDTALAISEANSENRSAQKALIEVSRDIQGEARKAILNLTGGDAYPSITPQFQNQLPDGRIPLRIFNNGRYPLTGVSVSFTRFPGSGDSHFEQFSPSLAPFTLGPCSGIDLPTFLKPSPDPVLRGGDLKLGVDMWMATMITPHGDYIQSLTFRLDEKGWSAKTSLSWRKDFLESKLIFDLDYDGSSKRGFYAAPCLMDAMSRQQERERRQRQK